jgi:glycosyltransferase involved in cell wall biosynthesis
MGTGLIMNVSIVIPVYNEASQLEACLRAIALQTVAPCEVIVVDNNSSDDSAAIASRYDFVTVLQESRQGVVNARNRGFDAATGELIGRIDADTILPPNWVESLIQIYQRANSPRLFAVTACSDYRNYPHFFWNFMQRIAYFWPARVLIGHTTMVGSDMCVSRQLWRTIRSYTCRRSDIHEDMDLSVHIGRLDVPILLRPELKASVIARQWPKRTFRYPYMQLKIKFINH